MKEIFIYGSIALVVIIGGFFVLNSYIYNEKQTEDPVATDPRDATYVIDGEVVTLKDGVSEIAIPDSSAKVVTRYFGNEAYADLDRDGRQDTVLLLTQETGGSGTFYYVVAALNTGNGYVGSQGFFIGDRIAPQTTEVNEEKVVTVNYADRKPDEDFSVAPSVGKSIWLLLDSRTMTFGEIAQEAPEIDPSTLALTSQKWRWVTTSYANGSTTIPFEESAFTLTFTEEGTFSATTDCNNVSGTYVGEGEIISFTDMVTTLMFCEGSQESVFTAMLADAESYYFTSRGELVVGLSTEGGYMTFK